MSDGGRVRPQGDAWVVSVHASENADGSLGSGVVIDDRRILTCAHVAGSRDDGGSWTERAPRVWVAFPKAEEGDSDRRLPVDTIVFPEADSRVADLAVLYLAGPVPPGVTVAPLRCPRPKDLAEKRWWSFGFPDGDLFGESAIGQVREDLGYGRVRLGTGPGSSLRHGFSGAGLWSPDYGAVVAVIVQARGDSRGGRAITLRQADAWFPSEKISALAERWSAAAAGEMALSAWGWSLSGDEEGSRHWRPRGRGVGIDSERGYRFRGRTAALEVIKDWLDRGRPDRRVLVVTGAPGAGKSAVLGRIVTTADSGAMRQLPASDTGVRATAGSVGCAVHAKGKTALEVAAEIARAASAAIPEQVGDFAPALREALGERGRRFNVIIDALDEAASPAEARAIADKVILPAAETCADVGAQVVVGSRRADGGGDLLGAFGGAARLVDLDDTEFFAGEDLEAYVLATLRLEGAERPGNPYADDAAADPVAARIAELSQGNFLVAALTARTHGMYDEMPADPAALSFSPRVDDAMREYLRCVPPLATGGSAGGPGVSAETLLTALAFAEAPGLPAGLWRTALRALGAGHIPEAVLTGFARSAAASFLVESSDGDGRGAVFRLFHQALNDALLHAHAKATCRSDDEWVLTRAFLQAGRDAGWEHAPAYLTRSLPAHAARAGAVDDLLADDDYLLHADLRRVLQVTGQAASPATRDHIRLLGLTPEAVTATPAERAAMFSVTEALDGLGTTYREDPRPVPYRARWAVAVPRNEVLTLHDPGSEIIAVSAVRSGDRTLLATGGDTGTARLWDPTDGTQVRILKGHTRWVTAVCAVQAGDRTLLATASEDGTARLWDPADGTQAHVLTGHGSSVMAVCAVRTQHCTLLATASTNWLVRLWDPTDGTQVRILKGHTDWVRAMCTVQAGDRTLLATASHDRTVRLWDPTDGTQVRILKGHTSGVNAVCTVQAGDRTLLATASDDRTVRLWDPTRRSRGRILKGRTARVKALCEVQAGDRTLLATASGDRTVRLWDLGAAPPDGDMQVDLGWVWAVCEVQAGGRTLLAAGGETGTVRLWDSAYGSQVRVLKGHTGWVRAMCTVQSGGRTLLATASDDWTVRLWDPTRRSRGRILEGHTAKVNSVCAVQAGHRTLLATASHDRTVRLWDPTDGTQVRILKGHMHWVTAVCAVQAGGLTLLATASHDRTVRLWDPTDGTQVRVLEGHTRWLEAVCAVQAKGRTLLATACADGTVRLWDPADGTQVRVLEGHTSGVNAVCTVQAGDRTLLATASDDLTVRLWDPTDGNCALTVPVHHAAMAVTPVAGSLAVGLEAAVVVIKFEPGFLA